MGAKTPPPVWKETRRGRLQISRQLINRFDSLVLHFDPARTDYWVFCHEPFTITTTDPMRSETIEIFLIKGWYLFSQIAKGFSVDTDTSRRRWFSLPQVALSTILSHFPELNITYRTWSLMWRGAEKKKIFQDIDDDRVSFRYR